MHPLLIALSSIGIFFGMAGSVLAGWYVDEWIKAIFSYRFRATDTHVIAENKSKAVAWEVDETCRHCNAVHNEEGFHFINGNQRLEHMNYLSHLQDKEDNLKEWILHEQIKGMKWGVSQTPAYTHLDL